MFEEWRSGPLIASESMRTTFGVLNVSSAEGVGFARMRIQYRGVAQGREPRSDARRSVG